MRQTEKARDGQKLVTESSPDKSSQKVPMANDNFGGGPTNLSHSLKGDKSHMDYQKK